MFRPAEHSLADPPEVLDQEARELARHSALEGDDSAAEELEWNQPLWRLAQGWRAQDGHRSEDPYERINERYSGLREDL